MVLKGAVEKMSNESYPPSHIGSTNISHCVLGPKAKYTRRKWEKKEHEAVQRQLGRFLNLGKVPGKKDCMRCVDSEQDTLKSRTWIDVKNYIYTTLHSRKRSASREPEDDDGDADGAGGARVDEASAGKPGRKRKRRWRRSY